MPGGLALAYIEQGSLMSRFKYVAGLVAASWLILSSAAHSLLGWRQLQAQLRAASAPEDLVFAVKAGWQFAGVSMLCFAIIVIAILRGRYRDPSVSTRPVNFIGIAYAAYGLWALLTSNGNWFFLVFIVPGLLLLGVTPWRSVPREA